MQIKRWLQIVVVSLVGLFLFPVQALACACCSDEGEYRISFRKPSTSEVGLMREMRFGSKANLIDAPANLGVPTALQSDGYSLTGSLAGGVWKLALREGNNSGTLNLPLPPTMLNYAVDTHDGQKSAGGGPVLYKEWRFEGRANGTGFFRNASAGTYFLVLQGRGNRCDNAADFSHWRLELRGPKARYAFYGEMGSANASSDR